MATNILRKISETLNDENWLQSNLRSYAADEDNETMVVKARCLMGWFALECLLPWENEIDHGLDENGAAKRAPLETKILASVIREQFPERMGKFRPANRIEDVAHIIDFNDDDRTCFADVVRVVDKAAVRLDEELELIELAGGRTS